MGAEDRQFEPPIEHVHSKGVAGFFKSIRDKLAPLSEREQQDRFAEQIGVHLLQCADSSDPIGCSKRYLMGIKEANKTRGFAIRKGRGKGKSEAQQIPWVIIPEVEKIFYLNNLLAQIEEIENGELTRAENVSRPLRPAFIRAQSSRAH